MRIKSVRSAARCFPISFPEVSALSGYRNCMEREAFLVKGAVGSGKATLTRTDRLASPAMTLRPSTTFVRIKIYVTKHHG